METKMILSQVLKLIVSLFIIFALAGKWNYWQGWVFFAYILLMIPVAVILFKDKMDLAKERFKPGPGMKFFDKVFWVFNIILNLAIFIIAVLDTGRYKWSNELPIYVYVLSYIFLTLSSAIMLWAMHVNKWFSSVVRIQKDRKQKVVKKGPYAYVRHPGYVGGFFLYFALPLAFGSLYGLIPGVLMIPAIIIRTHLEDNTLKKELPDYEEYTKKVRYRLFPGIY